MDTQSQTPAATKIVRVYVFSFTRAADYKTGRGGQTPTTACEELSEKKRKVLGINAKQTTLATVCGIPLTDPGRDDNCCP